MASGHQYRANRPNTWLFRPLLVGCVAASMRYHDEIRVPPSFATKTLIGNEQRGARGHQRHDALKRFRWEFDAVERLCGRLVQSVPRQRRRPLLAWGVGLVFRGRRTTNRPVVANRNGEPADTGTLVHRPAGGEDMGAKRHLWARNRDRHIENGRKTLADEQLAEFAADEQ